MRHSTTITLFDCIICDDDDYHNDSDNYDDNGVFIGGK